jgi:hypothetical protein
VTVASKAFDELVAQRTALIEGMTADIQKNDFAQWCGRRKSLRDLTVLDVAGVRERIYPDFRLESSLGERPPVVTKPGYLDPLPVETDLVAFTSAVPAAVFRAAGDAPVDVDAPQAGVPGDPPGNRVRASLALPVLANALRASLFALDQGLSVTGQAEGSLPLFRYEHLRDRARALVADVQAIESRMLPIQFALDDFAQLVDAVRRPPRGPAGRARRAQPENRRADPNAGPADAGRAGSQHGGDRARQGPGRVRTATGSAGSSRSWPTCSSHCLPRQS